MKNFGLLILAVLLAFGLSVAASAAESETHTDHCLCGGAAQGVGDHTECETVTWTPISQAFEEVGLTMSTANFGVLPSGNYYLDGDVTVTKVSGIGTSTTPIEISICLNGHSITNSSNRVFGILRKGSVLNLCDCSWDGASFEGTVTGAGGHGGIVYTHTEAELNVFGGNYVGQAVTSGGAFAVACDGCGDLNGDGSENDTDKNQATPSVMNLYNGHITGGTVTSKGGTIVQYHRAILNMYGGTVIGGTAPNGGAIYCGGNGTAYVTGGTITGGTATSSGGAIYCSGKLYVTGGIITGGTAKGVLEEAYILGQDGLYVKTTTLSSALSQVKDSQTQHVRLVQDLQSTATISGTVYMDLGGHDLSGVTVSGTLYGMDSAVNDYTMESLGTLSYTLSGGALAEYSKNLQTIKRYMTIDNADGTVSFHRYYLGITKISLRPDTVSVGYKAVFAGTDAVKALLAEEDGFGCHLWISPKVVVTRSYGADQFENKKEVSFRVNNFLNESKTDAENLERAQKELHAEVFLRFADGTELTSADTSYTFQEMLELANDNYADYSLVQKNALLELSKDYTNVMMTWDVSNIHHATGSMWTEVSASGFLSKLTKSGNYYNVASGNYVFTEDVDISDKQLKILSGSEVTICLNGHTISGNTRLFRNYGKLTICDCHREDAEGTITSSYTTTDPSTDTCHAPVLYAYAGSLTELYGGNLMATEQVTSAGVVAVSHDNSSNPDLPAAVMNMYGGTISGGSTVQSGGLIAIWNGGTFNMYGGVLENGSAQTVGGAIYTGSGSVNVYGGTIRNTTSEGSGGGIYNGDTLTISDGLIQNCVSGTNGGGVYSYGDFCMSGGVIEDCTAENEGGGVRISSTYMQMSGGSIQNCTAKKGGNVLLASAKGFTMSGGIITGGTAETYPGLCLVNTKAVMSGSPQVYGNNGTNLGMDWKSSISASDMQSGANVYVSAMTHGLVGEDTTAVGAIICEDEGYVTQAVNGKSYLWSDAYTELVDAPSGFSVGFGRVNINPELGTALGGYGTQLTRVATEIDTYDLYATAVAITDENGVTVMLIACDLCNVSSNDDVFRQAVADAVGIPVGNIILSASHSHSTPDVTYFTNELNKAYIYAFSDKLIAAATQAMADRKSATMEVGSFDIEGMNFYRHYSYVDSTDGLVKYFGDHFGTATYNSTTQHVDDVDTTMHLVRFVRDGKDILLSNWRVHPHFTGGAEKGLVSSDLVGVMRYYVEQNMDVNFIYMQGAAGNINEKSKLSDVNHGLNYEQYGQKMAELIQNNLSCLKTCTPGTFQVENYLYTATWDPPTEEEYEAALVVYNYIYNEGNVFETMSERNAYCKTQGYESIYEVRTIVSRGNRGEGTADLDVSTISLGKDLAFFSAPNELWDTVSVEIEENSPFATTLCFGYANGSDGYLWYNMVDEYNAYEVYNHRYVAPDTVVGLIAYWKQALTEQYANLK